MKRGSLASIILLAAISLPAAAQPLSPLEGADLKVRPQDDFFRYANGGWLNKVQIPGDKASYGTFAIVREKANLDVRKLLEEAAAHPNKTPDTQLIGDFYASLMDTAALDRHGIQPLEPVLAQIESLQTLDDLAGLLGEFQKIGVETPIGLYVGPDDKNPMCNAVVWGQSGLGMPDRDYYLKKGAEADSQRKAYVDYLATLYRLAGIDPPEAIAKDVMALETELATLQWARADLRDPIKTYNFAPRQSWNRDYGSFPWDRFAESAGMPKELGAIINEPSYFKGFAGLSGKIPMSTWKGYLQARLLDTFSSHLNRTFREAAFGFHGKTLNGLTHMAPRWKTAVGTVNGEVGEAVGIRYVAAHFSPDSKKRMNKLVDNLVGAYREALNHLDWMTPATRQAALEKLGKIRVKVGYPDNWRGYKGLVVHRNDALGNILRANRYLYERNMAEAGKLVDRTRWDMTPQTVNAYYNPVGNEIVFPAAILQPPFFDPKGDDAYNYGGIGAVIGHEITHGFDDQGRHYDSLGALRDWWTPEDEKAFTARADRLARQYSAYSPLPNEHVNGRLTLGENIADLGGVSMAYRAYHRSLVGKTAPAIQGVTGDQRFFLGYAHVWRTKMRPAALQEQLISDPHSPGQYRTNGVVTNVDPFYKAYGLKEGDRLFKAPKDRIHIW